MPERAYVSRSSDSIRMFNSDWMEFLSRVHPATPLVIYLPLIVVSVYFALEHAHLSILSVAELFAVGVAIWTSTVTLFITSRSPESESSSISSCTAFITTIRTTPDDSLCRLS
jgi:hypothetical protein